MDDLDLRRLRLLRELRERGTLAAVAEALAYSPSAISQQLAVLEQEVGQPLLERAGRGVRLTDAGVLLAERAGELLATADGVRAELAALAGQAEAGAVRGTVRGVSLQSALHRLLVPAAAQLARTHPGVRVELSELELEQALPELRLGRVDLVVVDEYAVSRPRPAGVRVEELVEEELLLALPPDHPLAGGGDDRADAGTGDPAEAPSVRLADLRDEVWVASGRTTGHTAMVLGACRERGGFDPDLRHLSSDAQAQLEMVRTLGAVALLPALALQEGAEGLAVRRVAGRPLRRRLLLMTRDGVLPPPTELLVGTLRELVLSTPRR